MKTRTKLETVYTLEEVLEKAIEKYWDINLDYDWYEFICDDAQTIFELIGFRFHDEKQPFYFSGFSSQGDGACINKAYYDYNKGAFRAIKAHAPQDTNLHYIVKSLQDLQRKAFYTVRAAIKHSGHYYHERSMSIDSYCEKGSFDEDCFRDIVAALCSWLYKRLERGYYYLTSPEAIEETLRSNEYDFNEEGSIA